MSLPDSRVAAQRLTVALAFLAVACVGFAAPVAAAEPEPDASTRVAGKHGAERITLLGAGDTLINGTQVYEYLSEARTPLRLNYRTEASTKPVIMVYGAEHTQSSEAAYGVLQGLGLIELAERASADVYLVGAVDGRHWDDRADWVLFDRLQYFIAGRNHTAMGNTKLIGIGDGATFVNDVLSTHAQHVADIVTWGGLAHRQLTGEHLAVPAYLAGSPDAAAVAYYRWLNAIPVSAHSLSSVAGIDDYAGGAAPLQRVLVDKVSTTAAQAIAAAYTHLLQHNLRLVISDNFWTPQALSQSRDNSLTAGILLPLMAFDGSSSLDYRKITDGIVGGRDGQEWLQFIPRDFSIDPLRLRPMVVFFHGGGNDPGQIFTSGWTQIAERDGILLFSVEHAFHDLDVRAFIDQMIAKYHADPSRIYATGLSGGGLMTNVVTLMMGERFAAVGAFAGADYKQRVNPEFIAKEARLLNRPGYPDTVPQIIADYRARGVVVPYSFSCGSNDRSFPIWYPAADGEDWQLLPMLNRIGELNGIAALARLQRFDIDTSRPADAVMGYPLPNRKLLHLHDLDILTGTFTDAQGNELVMLSSPLNLKHWYYYQATEKIWDWMKQYSRNPQTLQVSRNGRLLARITVSR
jgi:poly(3-hydroxybutyrate) depolymerase